MNISLIDQKDSLCIIVNEMESSIPYAEPESHTLVFGDMNILLRIKLTLVQRSRSAMWV